MPTLRESIAAIVEALVGRRLDYLALYPCSVAAQHADRTLDLIPDDAIVRGSGCNRIKLRHGLPGCTCTVPAGTRVLLGFESGNPRRPYATLWDDGAATTIVINTTGTIEIDGSSVDLGGAVSEVLRNGEIIDITGVMAGPGVVGALVSLNAATPGAGVPAVGASRVKA